MISSMEANQEAADLRESHGNAWFDTVAIPTGYRFAPTDEELITRYLAEKVKGQPLPSNTIREVDIYQYTPEELEEEYGARREKEMYFFTIPKLKYVNGSRPNREARKGFWRASTGKQIKDYDGHPIGYKMLLNYRGNIDKRKNTDWLMHEYTINPSGSKKTEEYVLCKVYRKDSKSNLRIHEQPAEESWENIPSQVQPVEPCQYIQPEVQPETPCQYILQQVQADEPFQNIEPQAEPEEPCLSIQLQGQPEEPCQYIQPQQEPSDTTAVDLQQQNTGLQVPQTCLDVQPQQVYQQNLESERRFDPDYQDTSSQSANWVFPFEDNFESTRLNNYLHQYYQNQEPQAHSNSQSNVEEDLEMLQDDQHDWIGPLLWS